MSPLSLPPLPRPAALLCDMDGTLVDTEHAWLDTVAGFLRAQGSPADADTLAPFAGAAVADSADRLVRDGLTALSAAETATRLDRAFTARVAAGVAVQPGALRLLDRARALGVPTALVTASERHVADLVLDTLGRHRFDTSIASGEAPRGKPHPDPYLAAAAALGVAPQDCLAVEDTPTGAAAALAAGCRLLAVPSVPGIEPGPRTVLVTSLTEADLAGAA
ncbi:HAD family phosphatase [Streptomyces sp. C11-1]|uniref:HAD family phosphatase n=1 Tax=Streptomyces durocortorensis TaxID=2811104 RepID=A0ABY9VYE1_9ACTN|nr:HAD family phosphatase [Streptomyces durocortorensis]WNF27670.1 HAD family phosphatase [Streptomyces durocortorensis]